MEWAERYKRMDITKLYSSGLTHILRSMTAADEKCYNVLIQTATVKKAIEKTNLSSPEIILFKFNKNIFYKVGNWMRFRKFSKDSFPYDTKI